MSKTDHRKKTRKRPITLVYVELAPANGGMMRDLSDEGFAIRAMMPLRAGEKASFSFSLSQAVRIEGEGQVLWVEEGGRVAGVQFTEISEVARQQIQEWLIHPEVPPSRERVEEKAPAQPNLTIEQLRAELHAVPPRPEETRSVEPPPTPATIEQTLAAPTPAIVDQAPLAPPPAPVETFVSAVVEAPPLSSSEPVDSSAEQASSAATSAEKRPEEVATREIPPEEMVAAPETVPDKAEIPALPRLRLTPAALGPESQPPASTRPSPVGPAIKREKWPLNARASEEPRQPEALRQQESALPDISSILIQPLSRGQQASHLEPIPAWEEESARRQNWISVSTVVKVMTFLALAAGIYVFHREVGQQLIWLGEAMGGVSQAQSQTAPVPGDTSAGSTVSQPTAQSGSVASQPAPATPSDTGTTGQAPPNTAPTGSAPQTTGGASTSTENPGAPVSPLSGIAPPPSNSGAEQGQTEYADAMQILRGRNADAQMSEALRLLWTSVEKGNPNAELALADMYWEGRGVARNCDQTRILLTAAARKGSAEAQKRLQQFDKQGCE